MNIILEQRLKIFTKIYKYKYKKIRGSINAFFINIYIFKLSFMKKITFQKKRKNHIPSFSFMENILP